MSPQLAGSAHSRRWSTRRPAHSRSLAVGLKRHGVYQVRRYSRRLWKTYSSDFPVSIVQTLQGAREGDPHNLGKTLTAYRGRDTEFISFGPTGSLPRSVWPSCEQ